MVEVGDSAVLKVSPSWARPIYQPSKRRVIWPNGAIAHCYGADEPSLLRGPEHDIAWADELAAWRYPEAWDNLMFGLRRGPRPHVVVTTTPKPRKLIRDLLGREGRDVVVSRASTYANKDNLAEAFYRWIVSQYEGTRLGRQEIAGELLEDVPGALWKRTTLELLKRPMPSVLARVVVAVDPAVSAGDESDETGIVVAGIGLETPPHLHVLADLSGRYDPSEWPQIVCRAYRDWRADRVVAEVNQGGDMVERVIRVVDPQISYRSVHATRGKIVRAEPVAALYEKGQAHHCGSGLELLEDQMCSFTGGPKKEGDLWDRMDALVLAGHDLIIDREPVTLRVVVTPSEPDISPV